jgi:hypothetical protein
MTPDSFALASFIVLLVPMIYFGMVSPTFLLVKLDIPTVSQLLRGLFKAYFLMVSITGLVGTIAFAIAGRFAFAICVGLITVFAIAAGRWFLQHIDAEIRARDAGVDGAVQRLRRLHWSGMACNAVQLVAVVASIPYVLGS